VHSLAACGTPCRRRAVAFPANRAIRLADHVQDGALALNDDRGQSVDRVAGGHWFAGHARRRGSERRSSVADLARMALRVFTGATVLRDQVIAAWGALRRHAVRLSAIG